MTWRWCSDRVERNPRYLGLPTLALGKSFGEHLAVLLAHNVDSVKLKEGESAWQVLHRKLSSKTMSRSFHKAMLMLYESLGVGNYSRAPASHTSNTMAFARHTWHMYVSLVVTTFSTHGTFATPHIGVNTFTLRDLHLIQPFRDF